MKCAKIMGPREIVTTTMERPDPKEGYVLFKVDTCGICGSDIHYWVSGEPKGLVMGHEFAGTVLNNGGREDLKNGDRITGLPISPCGKCDACKSGNPQYCLSTWNEAVGLSLTNSGGYAEYSMCRTDMVRKIPKGVSSEEACMVEPSAVSLHAINLANVKVGDKVLIIGGGIIGLMAAEFAKLNGASYVALMETNEKRGKKALKYGKVDEYFNALEEGIVEKLFTNTNGGFDKVIECCGNGPAVSEAIMTVKPGGRIVLVGVSLGAITIPTVLTVMREVDMQGAIAYTEDEFDMCLHLIDKKKIDVKKYIDAVVPLEKAQESFERLTSGKDDAIKIMFKPEFR